MSTILMVGLGGALGSMARYSISLLPVHTLFPFLTFCTNLLGSFCIGFIAGVVQKKGAGGVWLPFWKTGFCGGFTTFSTFSLEALTLLEKGHPLLGCTYIATSLLLCMAGTALGQYVALHSI